MPAQESKWDPFWEHRWYSYFAVTRQNTSKKFWNILWRQTTKINWCTYHTHQYMESHKMPPKIWSLVHRSEECRPTVRSASWPSSCADFKFLTETGCINCPNPNNIIQRDGFCTLNNSISLGELSILLFNAVL